MLQYILFRQVPLIHPIPERDKQTSISFVNRWKKPIHNVIYIHSHKLHIAYSTSKLYIAILQQMKKLTLKTGSVTLA